MIDINRERLLHDLHDLAAFGRVGDGVHRLAFSPEDLAARQWLVERMRAAGLAVRIDGVGNVYGQMEGVRRTVLIGSHTDTVPKGGWLDGAMGVIFGLEVARALVESGTERGGVDVISFADEEGTFYGTLGSLSFIGAFGDDEVAVATNLAGQPLAEALAEAGYGGEPARLDPDRHIAFMEAHIEQGPRLEAAGRRIGVVTGIVGMRRIRVTFHGQADHAGTTPMDLRKDAGAALFRFASGLLDSFADLRGPDTVWNCGHAALEPGAGNVVPERADLLIEFRDQDEAVLERMQATVDDAVRAADGMAGVAVDAARQMALTPAAMAPDIQAYIANAARALGEEPMIMPSGAGHDAMHLARHVPTGMLFVPSLGGRSHSTAEDTSADDIVLGARVLAGAVAAVLGAP